MGVDKKIANNIKKIREKNGIKQIVMANFLNIKEYTYAKYEQGIRKIPLHIIHAISRASFVPVDDILYGDVGENLYDIKMEFDRGINFFSIPESLSKKCFELIFNILPIYATSKKSLYFEKASKLYDKCKPSEDELNAVLLEFENAYKFDCVMEGAVNALSIIGYIWLFCYRGKTINNPLNKDFNSILEVGLFFDKIIINKEITESFFNKYGNTIYYYLEVIGNSIEYNDFAYYYIALQYKMAMIERTSYDLSCIQTSLIGDLMLKKMRIIGNEYANDFYDYFELLNTAFKKFISQ